jgi:hypothetical protein
MRAVSIDREIAPSVEDDVIVDDDFRLGDDRRWAVARKRVRPTAYGNRFPNALLGACKHRSDAASPTESSGTTGPAGTRGS